MKIDKPVNVNYAASIVEIKNKFPIPGRDKIVTTNIQGFQVIVSNDTEGKGIFFPAECQLSDKFCYENNLYRHENLNKVPNEKGYFEDNRRIRAIKFSGVSSNGFFMPISSLAWTGINLDLLEVGDEFDTLNGQEICRKYVVPVKEGRAQAIVDRGFIRTDTRYMPEHIDTVNFFRNFESIHPETQVIVTQKLHGTSVRIGHTLVNRKPTIIERVAAFFGALVQPTEYAELYGSRKVIKDANNPAQKDYYGTDIWSTEGKKLDGLLPKNYLIYGELVGWTAGGMEIQKGYTYGMPKGTCELYIYRIAIVNEDGHVTDLSWTQVKEFCSQNNLKHVPELGWCPMKYLTANDFENVKKLLDVRYFEGSEFYSSQKQALWLGDDKGIVDEGICVRAEGITPKILKAKSPKFLEHETKLLDQEVIDLESSQSNA